MPKDPIGETWTGGAYNGFAGHSVGTAAPAPPPPPAPAERGRRRALLIGGVAGAAALGLVLGVVARPQLAGQGAERTPMQPVATQAALEPAVPVEVAEPQPAPPPRADGPLEVLPPELAEAAPTPAAPSRPAAPAREPAPPRKMAAAPPPVVVPRSAPEAAAPVVARAPDPAPLAEPRRERANPSFNCRYARSVSERMVCGDPELAAADRRLARAYDRAVAAGVPARGLRAEQDDWLSIRDDAARHSPDAVASVYEQRIRELNALARDY